MKISDITLPPGLAADRPAPAIPGRLYYSADTGALERDTGAAWEEYATSTPTVTLPDWITEDARNPPAVAHAKDDEFDSGPALDAKWTVVGAAHLAAYNSDSTLPGMLYLEHISTAVGAERLGGVYQSAPVGDFIATTLATLGGQYANYTSANLFVADAAGPGGAPLATRALRIKIESFLRPQVSAFNDLGDNATAHLFDSSGLFSDGTLYLRIRRVGTTYYFEVSQDGRLYMTLYVTSAIGITVSTIGLAVGCHSLHNPTVKAAFDFFRVTE